MQACPGRHPVLPSLRTGAQPQVVESPAGLPPCLQLVLSWGPLAYLVMRCLEAVGSVVWSHVDLTVAPRNPHAITGLQDTLPYTHRGVWACFPLKPRGHGRGNQDSQRASGPRSDFAEAETGNAASARAGAPRSCSHAVGHSGLPGQCPGHAATWQVGPLSSQGQSWEKSALWGWPTSPALHTRKAWLRDAHNGAGCPCEDPQRVDSHGLNCAPGMLKSSLQSL